MDKQEKTPTQHFGEALIHFSKAFFALAFLLLLIWYFFPSFGDEVVTDADKLKKAFSISSESDTSMQKSVVSEKPLNNFDPSIIYSVGDTIIKDGIEVKLAKLEKTSYGMIDFTFVATIHDDTKTTFDYAASQWFSTLYNEQGHVSAGLHSFCNQLREFHKTSWSNVACLSEKDISAYADDLFGQEVYVIYTILPITVAIRSGNLSKLSVDELKQLQDVFVFKVRIPEKSI